MKKQLRGLLIGLVVQYLLGMATNLYVKFPETGTAEEKFHVAWGHFLSAAHIIVGLALLLSSLALVWRVYKGKDESLKPVAWVGFVAILIAGGSGSQFVATQNDAYSLTMAIAFIVALVTYGWGFYRLKQA